MTVIGHQRQKNILSAMAASLEIPHTMIFEGLSKLGKRKLALEFISKIFCEEKNNCGLCRSCIDISKGVHPDLIEISSQKREIQINQIRDDLIQRFSLKPYSAPFKAAIIDNAHLMNRYSQNSILKLLEEPGGDSIIILVTDYPESLLATVRSRARRISFFPVSSVEIERCLRERGCNEDSLEEITLFSFGRPGVALEFLSDPTKIKERKEKINEFLNVISPKSPFRDRFKYVKELAEDSTKTEEMLKMWLSYFRALMIKKAEENRSLFKIKKSLEEIEESIHLISKTNTNRRMVLEKLIMEL